MPKAATKNGTKAEDITEQIARAVGAGKAVAVETVDFADPQRPKTCLEVDFPILPINQIATIEGNAGKPIYQMSKWWARRRSSVFRSLLLAASMKAPEDAALADKAVWDVYYANHQKKGALRHLKVADIFMGGGTTIVEGSRLGMQMLGVDLNPVAWFVVKNEMAKVEVEEVRSLLADIEAEVKPQIMPFYACDCPRGHRGTWTHLPTRNLMGEEFNPLSLTPEDRKAYRYEGPESIYVFWAKHGPCQVTGCGHRTPIMSSPVIAVKTLSVKTWENHRCPACRGYFDIEEAEARMAPGAPLVVAEGEKPYAILEKGYLVKCPHCGQQDHVKLGKGKNKKIELTLLVHIQWLAGSPKSGSDGQEYGGSATDTPEATAAWNRERASKMRLLEVRGALPEKVICPETGITFETSKGTVTKKSTFACQAPTCGREQDVLDSVRVSEKTAPVAAYAMQGYCPTCDRENKAYGGRFFAPVSSTAAFNAACREWVVRSEEDLKDYWPKQSEVPEGLETSIRTPLHKYHYKYWWEFFNPRQLLVHALLLREIKSIEGVSKAAREIVLAGFQQYLRCNNMFCIWNIQADKLEPFLSKNNMQPPTRPIENCVFHKFGRGNWASCQDGVVEALEWSNSPWELVSNEYLKTVIPQVSNKLGDSKSTKVRTGDPVLNQSYIQCESATDLNVLPDQSIDLVITDPPFGDIMQYSELSGFFYAWIRLFLVDEYSLFKPLHPPMALEAVENNARHRTEAGEFYKKILTACWKEAYRILKPTGILAFTFHHDKDEPWVAVLESLFDASFYLEAAYPVRSDETKGEGGTPGTFGAQKVEYDIIHVCRKRLEEPKPVSWGRMRREVQQDVRHLQALLEHHAKEGLPAADLQVIRRGKALEYYSRHYGKVYVDEDREVTVRDALLGINQLLDEESGKTAEPPPITAEPFTRQFLRIFDGRAGQPRDQLQKYLRGTGIAPQEFEERGWCREDKKIYSLVPPLEIAHSWLGRHRRNMASDYDQAMFLIGACVDGSGINASDTLNNEHFRPHPALRALLEWHTRRAATSEVRNAAIRALSILQRWESSHQAQVQQLSFFNEA